MLSQLHSVGIQLDVDHPNVQCDPQPIMARRSDKHSIAHEQIPLELYLDMRALADNAAFFDSFDEGKTCAVIRDCEPESLVTFRHLNFFRLAWNTSAYARTRTLIRSIRDQKRRSSRFSSMSFEHSLPQSVHTFDVRKDEVVQSDLSSKQHLHVNFMRVQCTEENLKNKVRGCIYTLDDLLLPILFPNGYIRVHSFLPNVPM